jgi:hypothetical protein
MSQKIHSLPICILSSCLLCNLYFKINFYKTFKFIIGLKQLISSPWCFKEFMIGIRPYHPSGLRGYCFGFGNCEGFLSFIWIGWTVQACPTLTPSVYTVGSNCSWRREQQR